MSFFSPVFMQDKDSFYLHSFVTSTYLSVLFFDSSINSDVSNRLKMAASYTFEDLSGAGSSTSDNPYDGLIEACENDPVSPYLPSLYHHQSLIKSESPKSKPVTTPTERPGQSNKRKN